MAISYLNQGYKLQRWAGLSTDIKPIDALPGATFTEIDTRITYIYLLEHGWINYSIFKNIISTSEIDSNTHNGDVYTSSNIYAPLAFGNKYTTRLLTPDSGKVVHIQSQFVSVEGASIKLTFYNKNTMISPGFEITPIPFLQNNENYLTTKFSGVRVFTSIPGNLIQFSGSIKKQVALPGNTTQLSVTGGSTQKTTDTELILLPNSNYIVEFENIDENEDVAYNLNVITTIVETKLGGQL